MGPPTRLVGIRTHCRQRRRNHTPPRKSAQRTTAGEGSEPQLHIVRSGRRKTPGGEVPLLARGGFGDDPLPEG